MGVVNTDIEKRAYGWRQTRSNGINVGVVLPNLRKATIVVFISVRVDANHTHSHDRNNTGIERSGNGAASRANDRPMPRCRVRIKGANETINQFEKGRLARHGDRNRRSGPQSKALRAAL